jgi:hypothetical protein
MMMMMNTAPTTMKYINRQVLSSLLQSLLYLFTVLYCTRMHVVARVEAVSASLHDPSGLLDASDQRLSGSPPISQE